MNFRLDDFFTLRNTSITVKLIVSSPEFRIL